MHVHAHLTHVHSARLGVVLSVYILTLLPDFTKLGQHRYHLLVSTSIGNRSGVHNARRSSIMRISRTLCGYNNMATYHEVKAVV